MNDRKVVIDINLNTIGGNKELGANQTTIINNEGDTNIQNIFNSITNKSNGINAVQSVFVNQAYQYAKQAVLQSVNYGLDRHFKMNEDYKGQNDKSNALTIIGKASSFGTAIGGGASGGAMFGPVGALVGATIGAVGFGINEIISYNQSKDQQNIILATTNANVSFARTRAGLSNNSRGTEN